MLIMVKWAFNIHAYTTPHVWHLAIIPPDTRSRRHEAGVIITSAIRHCVTQDVMKGLKRIIDNLNVCHVRGADASSAAEAARNATFTTTNAIDAEDCNMRSGLHSGAWLSARTS
jgi:peptidoglycan/xylan/chitin deacetylase (PgdA/CDA1 family)